MEGIPDEVDKAYDLAEICRVNITTIQHRELQP